MIIRRCVKIGYWTMLRHNAKDYLYLRRWRRRRKTRAQGQPGVGRESTLSRGLVVDSSFTWHRYHTLWVWGWGVILAVLWLGSLRRRWNNRKYGTGKVGIPQAKEFLRNLPAVWARALENCRQPRPRPIKSKEYRFEGTPAYLRRPCLW